MKIVRCTDAALLRQMQREILPLDATASTRIGWWWVAIDENTPVGFAGMYQSVRWSDAVYLCRAGVVEAYRGRGLQRKLIRVRLAQAKRIGMHYAITDTQASNPSSSNNLIACGFRLYLPSNPWASARTLYWRKELTR